MVPVGDYDTYRSCPKLSMFPCTMSLLDKVHKPAREGCNEKII